MGTTTQLSLPMAFHICSAVVAACTSSCFSSLANDTAAMQHTVDVMQTLKFGYKSVLYFNSLFVSCVSGVSSNLVLLHLFVNRQTDMLVFAMFLLLCCSAAPGQHGTVCSTVHVC